MTRIAAKVNMLKQYNKALFMLSFQQSCSLDYYRKEEIRDQSVSSIVSYNGNWCKMIRFALDQLLFVKKISTLVSRLFYFSIQTCDLKVVEW